MALIACTSLMALISHFVPPSAPLGVPAARRCHLGHDAVGGSAAPSIPRILTGHHHEGPDPASSKLTTQPPALPRSPCSYLRSPSRAASAYPRVSDQQDQRNTARLRLPGCRVEGLVPASASSGRESLPAVPDPVVDHVRGLDGDCGRQTAVAPGLTWSGCSAPRRVRGTPCRLHRAAGQDEVGEYLGAWRTQVNGVAR
jgi:hypothetical protein